MEHFQLEAVGDGVWAAISLPGTGSVANAGIVDLGGATLVFDTFVTPQAAEALRSAAEQIGPVRWVVNSHYHGDHVRGNMAFPDAPIVATKRTRDLIVENGFPQIERMKAMDLEEAVTAATDERERGTVREIARSIDRLEQRLPDLTFTSQLTLHGEMRNAELITFGGGHTESDAVLWVADARVCFTADLVVIETHPNLTHGDPEEWLEILDRIAALDADTIVPGHGPFGGRAAITTVRAYLESMLADPERPPEPGWDGAEVHPRNAAFLQERAASYAKEVR